MFSKMEIPMDEIVDGIVEKLQEKPLKVEVKVEVRQRTFTMNGAVDDYPFSVDIMGNAGFIRDVSRIAEALERIAENLEDRG